MKQRGQDQQVLKLSKIAKKNEIELKVFKTERKIQKRMQPIKKEYEN